MSTSQANNCAAFEAHHLKPEKCRKCFGDKSRHPNQNLNLNATTTEEAKQQGSTKRATLGNRRNSQEQNESNNSNIQQVANSEQSMSRDELVVELKKCHEEKLKLSSELAHYADKEEQICKYKREIEKLKLEIRRDSKSANKEQAKEMYEKTEEVETLKSSCRLLEEERDRAREELKALEKEMEELHDNFKEDESEQFEQVKQELDLAMKNCKILQIRLNKSERQYNQLEQVKSMLERQLEETSRQQQQQHQIPTQQDASSAYFTQVSSDSVKLSTNEYDQLLRDLNDTIEREKDLQEQIKYSQEEAQLKSDRLQAVEAENEVLLKKVNKLTFANSRLRSFQQRSTEQPKLSQSEASDKNQLEAQESQQEEPTCDLIEQNEQLKLALDLTQSESDRLKGKLQQVSEILDAKENALKEVEAKRVKLEQDFSRFKALRRATTFGQVLDESAGGNSMELKASGEQINKLELECRQLRTKLVHSERECKQLKSQLEQLQQEMTTSGKKSHRNASLQEQRQLSKESSFDNHRHLLEQHELLKAKNFELEQKLQRLDETQQGGQMESDLLEKLKRRLDGSESELAKSKSRLVELDLENSKLQRQYKRLLESLEGNLQLAHSSSSLGRKIKLPPEPMRETMSRQELRQALKSLEDELEESYATLKAKNCLIKELQQADPQQQQQQQQQSRASSHSPSEEEQQVRSLHRLLDQERLLSNNLKIDVKNLEKAKHELQISNRMFERERKAMEEEMDKLRQLNRELNVDLEEVKKSHKITLNRLKEVQISYEKLRLEFSTATDSTLKNAKDDSGRGESGEDTTSQSTSPTGSSEPERSRRANSGDLLLMARDLSELKVKNGFLMRQLEIAREDTTRQLEDLRQSHEAQLRRAVELAQIKLKEKQLSETQQLRDELNDAKQKLATCQRMAARHEEEAAGERDKLRSIERDWRREKSHWQQRVEQLEAQLAIEKRSNEYRVKECESLMREKERELISVQDRYVQLERDLKRLQNKFNLLEENSESKEKNLSRDLEAKKRELSELLSRSQIREDEYYDNCKRFNSEKATLLEALESIKRSYDEKLAECKSTRELLLMRQDQAYKERASFQEKIDQLNNQLIKLAEQEQQLQMLKQQLQMQEKQQEVIKRECLQLKEDKLKLKTNLDKLEKRCNQYEKQELISKTSSISSSTFLKARNPFSSNQTAKQSSTSTKVGNNNDTTKQEQATTNNELEDNKRSNAQLVEKLTSKINDQRNLINMLKQQHDEVQMELKQVKLLNLADKSKWQIRVNQLKSQLADCEERLLFESSSLLSQETFDNSRRKLEIKWNEERSTMQEMIKQQQAQNEHLMRDLKKLTQSHDLLRLQSRQLESHNNKLSRKLIEYQQEKSSDPLRHRVSSSLANEELSQKLDNCLAGKRELELREESLKRNNQKLGKILREQVRPLAETVSKIVASLDSEKSSSSENKSTSVTLTTMDETKSTQRPLLTGREPSPDLISSAVPAHQQAGGVSRLSRFLGTVSDSTSKAAVGASTKAISTTTTKKRVKVKSGALGITPAEKRQLKRNLQELTSTLDTLNLALLEDSRSQQHERANSELSEPRPQPPVLDRFKQRGASHTPLRSLNEPSSGPHSSRSSSLEQRRFSGEPVKASSSRGQSGATSGQHSRVHWQIDCPSDCDSEKSWSGQLESSGETTGNYYKRFPQTTPSSYYTSKPGSSFQQASLTDCESESSLAPSDYSSYSSQRRFVSGTESDSCMATGSKVSRKGANRKSGLKLRLTSTLSRISRSISGLTNTSDSEQDGTTTAAAALRSKQHQKGPSGQHLPVKSGQFEDDDDDNQEQELDEVGPRSRLKEIRV